MYLSPMPGDGMGDFFILQCYTEIELHGIGTEEMGHNVIADVKGGRWDVIAESYGFIIWLRHFLAKLAKTAVKIPSETDIEAYTAVTDFMPEGETEDMRAVGIACDAFGMVDAGSFGIIAGIHIVETYAGTELEVVAVHGCNGCGKRGAHGEMCGDGGW